MQGSWKAVEGSTAHVIRLTMCRGLDRRPARVESKRVVTHRPSVHCLVIRSPGVLRRTLGLFKGTAAACIHVASLLLPSSSPPSPTQLHCSPTASSQTLSLYHDASPTAPLHKTPLQPPPSQHIHLSTRHRYQLQPALSPLSRPQPPHPRHHCIAPHRTATHQHCNHDAPLRLHLQHQLHGL